ncbi:hypothetical protein VKT23_012070 [Stygiomarasmius scandens]|uniref:Uncharacterized protein n=1 Tax=Marasmiellus scandens TaxID=2682957 RepID=A0ABR1JCB5_9AGAR
MLLLILILLSFLTNSFFVLITPSLNRFKRKRSSSSPLYPNLPIPSTPTSSILPQPLLDLYTHTPPLHSTVAVLTTVNLCSLILSISQIESMIAANSFLITPGTSDWTFGQILSIILVANPLLNFLRVVKMEYQQVQQNVGGNDPDEKTDEDGANGNGKVGLEERPAASLIVNMRRKWRESKESGSGFSVMFPGGSRLSGKRSRKEAFPEETKSLQGLPYYDDHQSIRSLVQHATMNATRQGHGDDLDEKAAYYEMDDLDDVNKNLPPLPLRVSQKPKSSSKPRYQYQFGAGARDGYSTVDSFDEHFYGHIPRGPRQPEYQNQSPVPSYRTLLGGNYREEDEDMDVDTEATLRPQAGRGGARITKLGDVFNPGLESGIPEAATKGKEESSSSPRPSVSPPPASASSSAPVSPSAPNSMPTSTSPVHHTTTPTQTRTPTTPARTQSTQPTLTRTTPTRTPTLPNERYNALRSFWSQDREHEPPRTGTQSPVVAAQRQQQHPKNDDVYDHHDESNVNDKDNDDNDDGSIMTTKRNGNGSRWSTGTASTTTTTATVGSVGTLGTRGERERDGMFIA